VKVWSKVMGFSISPAQQLYTMVDRLTGMRRRRFTPYRRCLCCLYLARALVNFVVQGI